jgi:CCR4-NOT transcription complex subunit 1
MLFPVPCDQAIKEVLVVQVLTAYCNMLNILRPAKAPGFAYAWLEIVSHRVFIGRILSLTPQQKGRSSSGLNRLNHG